MKQSPTRWSMYARREIETLESRCLLAAFIGGQVWHDLNHDGIRSYGAEHEVASATVHLLSSELELIESTSSDAQGRFQFARFKCFSKRCDVEMTHVVKSKVNPSANPITLVAQGQRQGANWAACKISGSTHASIGSLIAVGEFITDAF